MRIYVEYTQWPIKLLFTLMINFVKHINAELDKQVYFWVHDQQQLLRVDFYWLKVMIWSLIHLYNTSHYLTSIRTCLIIRVLIWIDLRQHSLTDIWNKRVFSIFLVFFIVPDFNWNTYITRKTYVRLPHSFTLYLQSILCNDWYESYVSTYISKAL